MKKILVLSVGGSAEPIVKAIRNYNPDFVYFFCSSGQKGSESTVQETHAVIQENQDTGR